ncbi:MAG: hypothetical protein BAJALOKI3v1_30070 [Promethearchaeota archaeon]|jgi:hypothetical protein|nr:MAG: hypothetical protein BAJALOKI3v1_30070 [Candidatus Lokiarchaeota archaeon]
MRENYCYYCGEELNLGEFIRQNYHLSREYLITLWDHPAVEFLCCGCFRSEALKQKNLEFKGKVE